MTINEIRAENKLTPLGHSHISINTDISKEGDFTAISWEYWNNGKWYSLDELDLPAKSTRKGRYLRPEVKCDVV